MSMSKTQMVQPDVPIYVIVDLKKNVFSRLHMRCSNNVHTIS